MSDDGILRDGEALATAMIPIIKQRESQLSQVEMIKWWAGFLAGTFGIAVASIGPMAVSVIRDAALVPTEKLSDEKAH